MKKIFVVFSLVLSMMMLASCAKNDVISEATARETALSHAKVSEDKATFVKTRLERDDGRRIYEVEFYVDGTEYDYEIDAKTGKIISFDSDADGYAPNQSKNDNSSKETQSSQTDNNAQQPLAAIDEAQALSVALKEVPGATESDARIYKDYDDGKLYYDVTIIYDNVEYEFEIDASTGAITERDSDSIFGD